MWWLFVFALHRKGRSNSLRSACHLVDIRLIYSAVRELTEQPGFMLKRSAHVTDNPRCAHARSDSLLIKQSVKMKHGCYSVTYSVLNTAWLQVLCLFLVTSPHNENSESVVFVWSHSGKEVGFLKLKLWMKMSLILSNFILGITWTEL
jgi:hypothetical protein